MPVANPEDLDAPDWAARSYVLTFATHERPEGKHDLDMSFLSSRPELVDPFCDYVHQWGKGKACSTRESIKKPIRYLQTFAKGYEQSFGIDLDHIKKYTTNFMGSFVKWLDGKLKVATSPFTVGSKLEEITIKQVYKYSSGEGRLPKFADWL